MRSSFLCFNDILLECSSQKRPWIFVIRLKATYIWPGLKIFCLCKSKLRTGSCKLRLCTLCMANAHDNLSRNCDCFITIDIFVFLTINEVPYILIGTQLLILAVILCNQFFTRIRIIKYYVYEGNLILNDFTVFYNPNLSNN